MPPRQFMVALLVALAAAMRERDQALDELDAARTALDGIGALVIVGRTPDRRPRWPLSGAQ